MKIRDTVNLSGPSCNQKKGLSGAINGLIFGTNQHSGEETQGSCRQHDGFIQRVGMVQLKKKENQVKTMPHGG